jgi:hypothetical protein
MIANQNRAVLQVMFPNFLCAANKFFLKVYFILYRGVKAQLYIPVLASLSKSGISFEK